MNNKNRGEKTVDFKGEKITLRLPINSICELEDKTGQAIGDFAKKLEGASPRMTDLRLFAWAMMIDDRPDSTVQEAGDLVQTLGQEFGPLMQDMFASNFPDPDTGPKADTPEKK